ncbi:MAG: small, acid-soluble spore protein, alpha/beta type [Thermaerobacter sp.]|nr:small, acid-soluble spore protein, alpha/beta type [Thermaerobacter sp.]
MSKRAAPGKLKWQTLGQKQAGPATEQERLRCKTQAAQALGLWEKVSAVGWGGLTAAEAGRIGGWMTRHRRRGPGENGGER